MLHGYDDTLELCFGSQNKNKNIINKLVKTTDFAMDNGIEGLSRIANSGKITPDSIPSYTHIVYTNRLEVLYGYRKPKIRLGKEEYLKSMESYKEIIQAANKYYDIVLVDLNNNLDKDLERQILNMSQVIVYNIEQKINMINDFLELKEEMDEQRKNKMILNIGRFDETSKYTIKNISRYTKMKKNLTVVPYNTLFFEAASEGNVADLFLKINNVSDTDKNAKFVKQVKEAVEKIIYKLQEVQMRS